MVFSLQAAVPLFESCGSVSHGESASVKVKVACGKYSEKKRSLSRKRRRIRRDSYRKSKSRKIMASVESGRSDSYWQNYFRCLKWTQNHHVAYWKSRVEALEYENRMLRSVLEQFTNSSSPMTLHNHDCRRYVDGAVTSTQWDESNEYTNEIYCDDTGSGDNNDTNFQEVNPETTYEGGDYEDDEFEFEVDNNMIEFFTQSMKHKLALRQERGEDVDVPRPWKRSSHMSTEMHYSRGDEFNYVPFTGKRKMSLSHTMQKQDIERTELEDILQRKADHAEKEKQKIELYGKDAPKIMGMETALQLNFRQVCLSKRPIAWPVIPLNL